MKSSDKRHLLILLFEHQGGRCCYCNRFVILSFHRGEQKRPEAATIEHLRQRSNGGKDSAGNFAMACRRCNGERGRTDWASYKSFRMGEIEEYDAALRG